MEITSLSANSVSKSTCSIPIEAEMKKIVKEDLKLEQFEMAPADAIKYLQNRES